MNDTTTFTVGTTYECRSISNHDTVYSFTVVKRTAKFVTFSDRWGDITRVGVWVSRDVEWACPMGKYANSATICADRPAV